ARTPNVFVVRDFGSFKVGRSVLLIKNTIRVVGWDKILRMAATAYVRNKEINYEKTQRHKLLEPYA
ncbi:MAG: hypothetical protein ACI9UK_001715, partial [Candidatus Krumholzibacteriia bacterium]